MAEVGASRGGGALGRDPRPAALPADHKPLGIEEVVRAHDCAAAHIETARQHTLSRQARFRGDIAAGN
jgi:hypothetical protein